MSEVIPGHPCRNCGHSGVKHGRLDWKDGTFSPYCEGELSDEAQECPCPGYDPSLVFTD